MRLALEMAKDNFDGYFVNILKEVKMFLEDRESYYEDALSYCGWEYCSKEEYEDNVM